MKKIFRKIEASILHGKYVKKIVTVFIKRDSKLYNKMKLQYIQDENSAVIAQQMPVQQSTIALKVDPLDGYKSIEEYLIARMSEESIMMFTKMLVGTDDLSLGVRK